MKKSSSTILVPETRAAIILRRISFSLVVVAALFLSIRQIYGEDIGFHLQAGRWMLQNFSFPDKDTFTYTANENKYIDLNWLYQLLMYGVNSIAGGAGMILMNSLFVVCSVLMLFKRSTGNSSTLLPWVFLSAILALSPTLEIRPHSLSWLLLSLVLYVLQQYYDGNKKLIRWLPLIMLLWVNCHSLFMLGIVSIGCYGVSIFFKKKELLKEYAIWASIAVVACLLNPYGWHGFSLPFEQMFALQEGNIFKANIRELQSPFAISEYAFNVKNWVTKWHFFDLFVLTTAIGVILQFKKLKVHEWLISIIFFYFAYSATKNIGYFAFAVTPILLNGFASLEKKKYITKYRKHITILFMVLCTSLILAVSTNAFYIHYRATYRFGLNWRNSNLPVKATEFLVKNNLHGKILNQLDFGGYLEYFANQKVAIDGRLDVMGEAIFSEQIKTVNEDAKTALITKLKPEIILFAYFVTPDWISYLQKRPDWRLVYVDECTAVYFKNSYAPTFLPVTGQVFAASLKQYSDAQIDELLKNKKSESFISAMFCSQYYPEDELNKAVFCFYYNWVDVAKQITANGFEKASSDYPELYQNLGSIFFQYKDKNRSLYCYKKYLEDVKNPQVEERVRFLENLN